MWRPRTVRAAVAGLMLILLLLPANAQAVSISGDSNTYLRARESAEGANILSAYEYLNIAAQDFGKENLSFHAGGWLRYELGAKPQEENHNKWLGRQAYSDLQYGYLSYRCAERNAAVNVGRVMVFEGVAAERVDGISARMDITGGFAISAFGGVPAETGNNTPGSSAIYGGRISHQSANLYTVGLSYLKEEKSSDTFRQEAGLDVWVKPAGKVEVMGRSSYNLQTVGWMENTYYLVLGPFDKLRFNTEASWINYADYFAGATSNVFKLTPGGPIDPKEKVSILGEEIFYAINANWAASVDYKKFGYDIAGSANYYGGKASFTMPKAYNAGVSIHKMDGENSRLKYDEYRIYASRKMDKLDMTADFLDVQYKEAINGVTNAYSATIAAGYEMTEKLKLGADLEYSKNPDFDSEVRFFLKLNYRFDAAPGKSKGV